MLERRVHLNLIDSSRQLFELDSGAIVASEDGWMFGAGSAIHPAISNAAFRAEDRLGPDAFLATAKAFFAERGRGFSVWARVNRPEDEALIATCEAAGLKTVLETPEMVLAERVDEPPLPAGAELRQLATRGEAEDYWRVAKAAYASNGFPPEVFAYDDHTGLLADNVAAFLAYSEGQPVAIAMTIVSRGVAGVYWVGSLPEARGQGLARAVTAAATNAGFDLGAEIASLQASAMGKPVYEAMGYETIYSYRLLMCGAP